MLFFFNKRPIHVDAFTYMPLAYECAPIREAKYFYPSWWKALPKETKQPNSFEPAPTMRTCNGFIDLYQHGYVMPLWSDLIIKVNEDRSYNWIFSDLNSSATHHPQEQGGGFVTANNIQVLKLHCPWRIKTKEELYWNYMAPFWSQSVQDDWVTPPGIVSFYQQRSINIFLLVKNMTTARVFQIDFLTPALHLVPLTDRPVKLHVHFVDKNTINGEMTNARAAFVNTSKKIFDARRVEQERKASE